jgi:hypothetical protein
MMMIHITMQNDIFGLGPNRSPGPIKFDPVLQKNSLFCK